jgi:acyl carrier protein
MPDILERKSTMSVRDQVVKIIAEALGVQSPVVTDDASFADDLCADSLDRVKIAFDLEDHFGVSIDDDAIEHVDTVGEMVRMVEARLSDLRHD